MCRIKINSLRRKLIEFQEDKIQIGIKIKLRPIKNNDKPSTPNRMLFHLKLSPKFIQGRLANNWKWDFSSNDTKMKT